MFIEIPTNKNHLISKKLIQGVGNNDAEYQVHRLINGKKEMCPYYRKWSDMIKRCYSEKSWIHNPSYKGCSVCDDWFLFSNFKSWMIKQNWKDKDLDKDIMIQGNKIYSPMTCLFVDPDINMLLTKGSSTKGSLPIGVSFDKQRNKYQAKCRKNGKTKMLGRYVTAKEAHDAYKEFKYKLIKEVALLQSEPLRSALLNYVIR